MKPTNKFRFIETNREKHGDIKLVRVLQQWWCDMTWYERLLDIEVQAGEWRDVPLETQE